MKKILLTMDYPPAHGGVAVYLRHLADQFSPEDITVVAPIYSGSEGFDLRQEYKIIRADLMYHHFWPRWLKSFFKVKEIIREEGGHHLIVSHLLPMGYVAMMSKLHYTVILHGMDIMGAKRSVWKKFWAKRILSKASLIIVNSDFTMRQVMSLGISPDMIEIAHPCPKNLLSIHFDQDRWEKLRQTYNPYNQKVIISVNRLVSRKGNDTVIRAMPEILKKLPYAKYLIIGSGPYQKDLEELIAELNLKKNVFIINDAPDSDLPYYYRMASLFVMTSRIENGFDVEGFGIAFLEAALFRVPSIGTYTGGIPEAVLDNETGILINPDDYETLAGAAINILSDDAIHDQIGDRAKARVLNEFTWEKQFSKIKSLLE